MIGSTVRSARKRAGVTQAQLATLCSTSQPAIARLEKGLVAPTVLSLDRIARALGAELVIDFEPLGTRGGASAPAIPSG
jgi:UDP-N-acetylglucosamine 1-carboxyvinyltransferase